MRYIQTAQRIRQAITSNPYDQIGFYADQVGQHLLMFVINGQPSNIVVIDVVASAATSAGL